MRSLCGAFTNSIWGASALAGPVYLFWYSRYAGREGTELRPGKPLPEFTLEDEEGRKVKLY